MKVKLSVTVKRTEQVELELSKSDIAKIKSGNFVLNSLDSPYDEIACAVNVDDINDILDVEIIG